MSEQKTYDTNLAMGLGLIEETKQLLQAWSPNMSAVDLYSKVLSTGLLSDVSAYRLRNIVIRCFANRFLIENGSPAARIKRISSFLTPPELRQMLFLYTCRANPILADFVREIYWTAYESAVDLITKDKAEDFIRRAIDDGKTPSRWADGQIERMGRYLTGCCSDFGLLGGSTKAGRRINPIRIEPKIATYLAYDLHFVGIGDNALLSHPDWQLFGSARADVLEEIKKLSLKGHLIIQVAGDVVRISWKQPSMEALCDVISQG